MKVIMWIINKVYALFEQRCILYIFFFLLRKFYNAMNEMKAISYDEIYIQWKKHPSIAI